MLLKNDILCQSYSGACAKQILKRAKRQYHSKKSTSSPRLFARTMRNYIDIIDGLSGNQRDSMLASSGTRYARSNIVLGVSQIQHLSKPLKPLCALCQIKPHSNH
jgi:hypothetical protein